MNQVLPEKFPGTGINTLATDAGAYNPGQWPEAINFVRKSIQTRREAAIGNIPRVPLSERQLFVVNNLVIPAVAETLSEVFGSTVDSDVLGTTFVNLFTSKDFEDYSGLSAKEAAGAYFSDRNQIAINQHTHTSDSPKDLAFFTKVFTHEYLHYVSHQFSDLDRPNKRLAIQRIGVRTLGEDIREANIGQPTWDYYLSSSEAINEMLTIQTLQKIVDHDVFKDQSGTGVGFHKTYADYRQLVDKTMDDARAYGATNLPKTDLWHSVARGYLTGELKPLIQLVHATYPGLSMKEFGLMTNAGDLPQASDFEVRVSNGNYNRVLSEAYLERMRDRLNGKTSRDYITDVPPPPPPPPENNAVIFIRDIRDHQQAKMEVIGVSAVSPDGRFVDRNGSIVQLDENGNLIHYDEAWLSDVLELLVVVSTRSRSGSITAEQAGELIDETLFDKRRISELSKGFEAFYVAKHLLLDPSTSKADFNTIIKESEQKRSELKKHR